MMRARHMKFPITDRHAEEWLGRMAGALIEIGVEDELRDFVSQLSVRPAHHFVNTP